MTITARGDVPVLDNDIVHEHRVGDRDLLPNRAANANYRSPQDALGGDRDARAHHASMELHLRACLTNIVGTVGRRQCSEDAPAAVEQLPQQTPIRLEEAAIPSIDYCLA